MPIVANGNIDHFLDALLTHAPELRDQVHCAGQGHNPKGSCPQVDARRSQKILPLRLYRVDEQRSMAFVSEISAAAKVELLNGDSESSKVAVLVGYRNASRFSEVFKRTIGMTPIQ